MRVQKVAPYLTLDGDPYPAVVNGRIVWIVDGYTTTDRYPYSTLENLDQVTSDSLTANSQTVVALQAQQVNYIRNSVKATVDAYSGKVTLYAWDEQDPVLKAWQKVFPNAVKPLSLDQRSADVAPALPRGHVQGPARPARPLPRHRLGAFYRPARTSGGCRRTRPSRPRRRRCSRRTT